MNSDFDFSIVTVTFNCESTIEDTVSSVKAQRGVTVQHVIKDGGSQDETAHNARRANGDCEIFVSSDAGIYDAMNQGFDRTRGRYVGFLNGDDKYIDESVLHDVAKVFEMHDCDFVFGGIVMAGRRSQAVRAWEDYRPPEQIVRSGQLPHPALFVRRDVLQSIEGPFDAALRIAGDLKLGLQLVVQMKAKGQPLRRPLVVMALGGESTKSLRSYMLGWRESALAYNEILSKGGWMFVSKKVLSKIPQLFRVVRPDS